ncbi:ferredoxin-NADP reductase [Streptomyces umbrinus]|uniref:Ferredoxin-NADP reductase n=1 Tax=Streptomyces umbrinus TaxID=67370 RepID=A0ABU0SGB5_9ACTN|nr:ferredoxin-NADP reductase [Streptomyces umbrinus]
MPGCAGTGRIRPQDACGPLDLASFGAPHVGTLVHACGPVPLLRALQERCVDWPAGTLGIERFAPVRPTAEAAFSCREGTCGTCETDVLDGTPDHRDSTLDED